jgi:DnaJ-class molecular chaperone
VQPDAPLALIQASYRTLMQKLRNHPDLGGDEWNATILNQAYAVLSDERKRRLYDAQLFAERTYREAGRQTSAQRSGASEYSCNSDRECQKPSASAGDGFAQHPFGVSILRRGYCVELVDSLSCAFCGSTYRGALDNETDCVSCRSPLERHDPLSFEPSSQRSVHRISSRIPLTFHTAWPGPTWSAILQDLSPNGFQFTTGDGLVSGQRLRAVCSVFKAVGEITNRMECAQGQIRYGARFVTLRYRRTSGAHFSEFV